MVGSSGFRRAACLMTEVTRTVREVAAGEFISTHASVAKVGTGPTASTKKSPAGFPHPSRARRGTGWEGEVIVAASRR